MTVPRGWGLHLGLGVAVVTGLTGAAFWVDEFQVPTVRLPVPMPMLFPVLSSVMLAWLLIERWPTHLATTVRQPWLIPAGRFLGTQGLCVLSAGIATGGDAHVVWLQCSVGASLAAVLTVLAGSRATLALLVCTYPWLFLAIQHPVAVAAPQVRAWAALALVVSGALYITCQARRHTP